MEAEVQTDCGGWQSLQIKKNKEEFKCCISLQSHLKSLYKAFNAHSFQHSIMYLQSISPREGVVISYSWMNLAINSAINLII